MTKSKKAVLLVLPLLFLAGVAAFLFFYNQEGFTGTPRQPFLVPKFIGQVDFVIGGRQPATDSPKSRGGARCCTRAHSR